MDCSKDLEEISAKGADCGVDNNDIRSKVDDTTEASADISNNGNQGTALSEEFTSGIACHGQLVIANTETQNESHGTDDSTLSLYANKPGIPSKNTLEDVTESRSDKAADSQISSENHKHNEGPTDEESMDAMKLCGTDTCIKQQELEAETINVNRVCDKSEQDSSRNTTRESNNLVLSHKDDQPLNSATTKMEIDVHHAIESTSETYAQIDKADCSQTMSTSTSEKCVREVNENSVIGSEIGVASQEAKDSVIPSENVMEVITESLLVPPKLPNHLQSENIDNSTTNVHVVLETSEPTDSNQSKQIAADVLPNCSSTSSIDPLSNTSPATQHKDNINPHTSGLNLLAQYQSDSDSEEIYEIPSTSQYQDRVIEIDSDTSSDSSDIEIISDINSLPDLSTFVTVDDDDDEDDATKPKRPPKVKGEFDLDDLPPIQNLQITVPEDECQELGKIQSIVDRLVIVSSLPGISPLDIDTVLFLNKGQIVLGEVFDVLGQVADPLYCVRFNTVADIQAKNIQIGQPVYIAPQTEHTQYIVLANLIKTRGSDASWENDIEPPQKYLDYSDDEEERAARRSLRNKDRSNPDCEEVPVKQPRGSNQPTHRRQFVGQPRGPPRHRAPRPFNYGPPPSGMHSWHQNFPPMHSSYPYRHSYPPPPQMVMNPYATRPPPHPMERPPFYHPQ